jgi:hypothetical protein
LPQFLQPPYTTFLSSQRLHHPFQPDSVTLRRRLYVPSKCQNTNLPHTSQNPKRRPSSEHKNVVSTDHSSI